MLLYKKISQEPEKIPGRVYQEIVTVYVEF